MCYHHLISISLSYLPYLFDRFFTTRAAVIGTVNSRRATMEYGFGRLHVMEHDLAMLHVIVIIYSPDIYKIMGRVWNMVVYRNSN